MARYFGGFRDRLLKKGRSAPLAERDVDWVKVSGTSIWSPEKRPFQWMDPEDYLSSFLQETTPSVAEAAPSAPAWDLGALANEPEEPADEIDTSYAPPTGLFSSGGMATPPPDIEADLPTIEEYKSELLSALRRRGLRVDVRRISLPEDVEEELSRFHAGDRFIDSHGLRARLQTFKKQVIASFDQFSRIGETYIIPDAPRYPSIDEADRTPAAPSSVDPFAESAADEPPIYDEALDGHELPDGLDDHAWDVVTDLEVIQPDLADDARVSFEPMPELDSDAEPDLDFESFVLQSLDKLEASMQDALHGPGEQELEADDQEDGAADTERAPIERRIYDPLNGTLDVPHTPPESSPRLKTPATGTDLPREHRPVPGFVHARLDGASNESWLVSPIQSRKAASLDRPVPDTTAPEEHNTTAPNKPDVLKALNTLRSTPAETPPPRPTREESQEQLRDEAREQARSILARLEQPTGDGHAEPAQVRPDFSTGEQRPDFPALESIAASFDDPRSAKPPTADEKPRDGEKTQSLSDFLLSLKNDHEEQHKATQWLPSEVRSVDGVVPPDVAATPSDPSFSLDSVPEAAKTQRPAEEKRRTISLFAKAERRQPAPEVPVPEEPAEPPSPEIASDPEAARNPLDAPVSNLSALPVDLARYPGETSPRVAWERPSIVLNAPVTVDIEPEEPPPHALTSDETPEAPARTEDETTEVAPAPQRIPATTEVPPTVGTAESFSSQPPSQPPPQRSPQPSPQPSLPQPVPGSPAASKRQIDSVREVSAHSSRPRTNDAFERSGDASGEERTTAPAVEQPAAKLPSVHVPAFAATIEPVHPAKEVAPPRSETPQPPAPDREETPGEPESAPSETLRSGSGFSDRPTDKTAGAPARPVEPVVPAKSIAPAEKTDTSMADRQAGPEDTDQRQAERLALTAREALEALERREAGSDAMPAPIEHAAPRSAAPSRVVAPPAPVVAPAESQAIASNALDGVVEALAFAADDPIPLVRVAKVFADVSGDRRPTEAQVVESVERLNALYAASGRAFRIKVWAGGIRMATDPGYAEYIRAIYQQERPKKLSRTLMETLAIIAYSQPTTKPEIDFIRGVDSDYAVRKLLELGLIDIVGRSEAIGKPLLYGTSERFLEQFGLSELASLPKLKEIEELLDDPSLQRERMHLLALENGLDETSADTPSKEEASSEAEGG